MNSKLATYKNSILLVKMVLALFVIVQIEYSFGQEPPPHLKLTFNDEELNGDDPMKRYEVSTYMFKSAEFQEQGEAEEWGNERSVIGSGDNYIKVFLYGETIRLPNVGDIYRFTIIDSITNNSMSVFVRTSYRLSYSEEIVFNNIKVLDGVYFLDMCSSCSKYEIPTGNAQSTVVNLEGVASHKISTKKLMKVIKKHKCLANDGS